MIIATRTMFIDTAAGARPVEIRLYQPEEAKPKWICRYEIDWPEGKIGSQAQGNDMIEAIHYALQKLGTEMYLSHYHHERKLRWLPGWVGYNFPVPKNGRDLLIGDDQTYFGLDTP